MTTRGRMAQIGQLGWLIRSLCDRDGRLGQWSRRGSRMRLPEPPECSLASDPFAVPLMACIVHRGIGHGEHDAGRATPVDRGRNAALRRARARGTRRGRRRRAERTDQQLILHARSAWMQDEGIARETIAMSMLWRCLVGSRSRFHSAGSRTALTGVSCWALGLGFAGAAVALVLLDIDEAQKVKSR